MYSDFLAAVNTGKVQTARIDDATSHVYFRTQLPEQEAASTSTASDSSETGACILAPPLPDMAIASAHDSTAFRCPSPFAVTWPDFMHGA